MRISCYRELLDCNVPIVVLSANIEQNQVLTMKLFALYLLTAANFPFICTSTTLLSHTCNSKIYCHGFLLDTIQTAKIFPDSKTFVDMPQKNFPNETYALFEAFMYSHEGKPTKEQIAKFVNETFETVGSELEGWVPDDWMDTPDFYRRIKDETLRDFGMEINRIWKRLGRKIREGADLRKSSLFWVPHPFIVPGGRFREYYYWDSYWIVIGLIRSGMMKTAKGMVENLLHLVERFGFVPNGGREYYSARSQIPFLSNMVIMTGDELFIERHAPTLQKEFIYWMNKSFWFRYKGKDYLVAAYGDHSDGPRPESFREDNEEAKYFHKYEERQNFFAQKKATCESGWDFSSRWFYHQHTKSGNITDTITRYVVPVDLIALLELNSRNLASTQRGPTRDFYLKYSEAYLETLNYLLWDDEIGSWFDFNMLENKRSESFYLSNLVPLFTGSYNDTNPSNVARVIQYIRSQDVLKPGGILTSHTESGQQWDFPNVWPPLMHMTIVGFQTASQPEFALELAQNWTSVNYLGFCKYRTLFEKYNALEPGEYGSGGEYVYQPGFGWTLGSVIDLLWRFGDVMKFKGVPCNW